MAARILTADAAALVAAQLTQAQMSLTGGMLAGRKPGAGPSVRKDAVETTYLRFLAFVESGAVLPSDEDGGE